MILQLYPYKLEKVVSSGTTQNADGDWVVAEERYSCPINCDLKEKQEVEVAYDDGTFGKSTYLVYTQGRYDVEFGDELRITFLDGSIRKFKVKAHHVYQLQTKIWV